MQSFVAVSCKQLQFKNKQKRPYQVYSMTFSLGLISSELWVEMYWQDLIEELGLSVLREFCIGHAVSGLWICEKRYFSG